MSLVLDTAAQDLLFREARTANTFTDEPVTDEQIQAIYDLVKYGPTSMNTQPLRIVLVRSAEARGRLVDHLGDGNKAKTAAAPLTAIVALDTEFHEHLPTQFPHFPGARDMWAPEGFRIPAGGFNAALQVGYLIVGIRAAGLAAGPMTGFDAEGVNKEFFPDGKHHVLAVINIGRPGEEAWFARSPRLDYDQVVTTV
ncbi:malonic semialdehyde reductase [Actinocorallia lasiicapitis]